MVIAEGIEDGIRDIDRNRVFTNAVNKKYAEMFARNAGYLPKPRELLLQRSLLSVAYLSQRIRHIIM
jgi:hypothetical protein